MRIDIGEFAASPDWRQDESLTVYLALASCRHAENVTLVFPKLNDLIDKYAPNLKRIMNEYPEGLTAKFIVSDAARPQLPVGHHRVADVD